MIEPLEIYVRYSDLDPMGHVNNAVYLNYFEAARVHYFKKVLDKDWDWNRNGMLVVRNEIDYIDPILLNDRPKVRLFLISIGHKSFRLGYEITIDSQIHCKGVSIMVGYDASTNKTKPIDEKFRKALNILK